MKKIQGLRLKEAGFTFCGLQSHILPTEDLACIYRFAVLLAGAPETAQAAILETFADAGEKIHHFRSGKSCKAWLVAKVRTKLMKQPGGAGAVAEEKKAEKTVTPGAELDPKAVELTDRFSKIPEPGRSALALLYLDSFSPQEIAQILLMNEDQLASAVDAARSLLRQMEAVQNTAATNAEEQGQKS